MTSQGPSIDGLEVEAFTVPTDQPEADATLEWDRTTAVVVIARAGGERGLGYSYTAAPAAGIVADPLATVVTGRSALAPRAAWVAMVDAVRNLGWPGLVSCAVSAVDIALWDLAARLRQQPVAEVLGLVHEQVPVYGSGGFCNYDDRRLHEQLGTWVDDGIANVKMKVGRDPAADERRIAVARDAIGDARLMVDANGGYGRKEALGWAERFADAGVVWFEEPVSSDDLSGLRLLRDRGPGGLDIAAGEYGYHLPYFEHMLEAGAVDCLQADVTRCGGFTGFASVAALCDARSLELSSHTAPHASAHACAATWGLRHLEYFHDHVRLERMLFDGVLEPVDGALRPGLDRPGLGLELRRTDADRYRVAA